MIGANMMPMPQMAIAIPRWLAGNVSIIVACESGTSGPPASPCRKRAITMTTRLGAAPAAAEVSVNATVATMKSRLRPSRSVSHPGDRQADGVGDEERGQHPRDLVHAGRQRAAHVIEGDVGDGDVEDAPGTSPSSS